MNFDVVEMISHSDTFVLEMCASLCVCQGGWHTKQTPLASIEVLFISIYNSPL